MKKINTCLLRKKKGFLAGIILSALCMAGCSNASVQFLESELNKEDEMIQMALEKESDTVNSDKEENMLNEQEETSFVYVHVCGAVVNPGVYEMKAGSRVFQAVEMAGGILESAAAEYINQAMTVTDGQQIYIPRQDEVAQENGMTDRYSNLTDFTDGVQNLAEDGKSDKININTADEKELMTISGIGESRAKDIIAYREAQGGFSAIEEIMNVPGIKEATFDKIKDSIEVK